MVSHPPSIGGVRAGWQLVERYSTNSPATLAGSGSTYTDDWFDGNGIC